MTISRFLKMGLVSLLAMALALPTVPAQGQAAEETDIAYEVVSYFTNEPMSLQVAQDGRIIWVERDGQVWVMTPQGVQVPAGSLMPAGNACVTCTPEPDYLAKPPNRLGVGGHEEGGLYDILLDRNFATNNQVYTYRSIPGTRHLVDSGGYERYEGAWRVERWTLDPLTNRIDMVAGPTTILEVPAEWDFCCHYGGDLDYLPDGTIALTTGDDIDAASRGGYGPRDTSAFHLNGELTAANPADRRGKILRFREDGTVPDGTGPGAEGFPELPNPFLGMEGYNPYIEDTSGTPDDGWIAFDPYVYTMGWKQPWRAVVHPESGIMYVGEVGPDGNEESEVYGPAAREEINMVPYGGGTHYGWPRCIGPNLPYNDVDQDGVNHGPLDCSDAALVARPIGSTTQDESWVTGMTGAPFHYPTNTSEEWPVVGSGGKTSEPVAYYPASTTGALRLPERYNDHLLMLEWSRKFILSIPYEPATGELILDNERMWRVTPPATSVNTDPDAPAGTVSAQQGGFMAPIDGAVGPDGAFYFLEYGAFFYVGVNGRLSRIKCAGCSPLDPTMNYGLPLEGTAPAATALVSGFGFDARTLAAAGLALALAMVVKRSRRKFVV